MNIMLATDGSPYALEAARFLSSRLRSDVPIRLDLVTVIPGTEHSNGSSGRIVTDRQTWWPTSRGWIEKSQEILRRSGLMPRSRILRGEAQEVLVKEAGAYDLVVAGVKGRGAAPFFELGSVARALLRHAPSSVLVVRKRRSEAPSDEMRRGKDPFQVLFPTDRPLEGLLAGWEILESSFRAPGEVEVVTALDRHAHGAPDSPDLPTQEGAHPHRETAPVGGSGEASVSSHRRPIVPGLSSSKGGRARRSNGGPRRTAPTSSCWELAGARPPTRDPSAARPARWLGGPPVPCGGIREGQRVVSDDHRWSCGQVP